MAMSQILGWEAQWVLVYDSVQHIRPFTSTG